MPKTDSDEQSLQRLRDAMLKLVKIPVDWSSIPSGAVLDYLDDLWQEVAKEVALQHKSGHSVAIQRAEQAQLPQEVIDGAYSSDADYFDPQTLNIQIEMSVADASAAITRISKWIDVARKTYRVRTLRYQRMHYASAKEYGKHFPTKKLTANQIRALSKRGKDEGSLFFQGITRELLQEFMWDMFGEIWPDIVADNHLRVYADAMGIIGVSNGADTRIICWDINFNSGFTHAFPVLEHQIPEGKGIYRFDDSLVGFAVTK